MRLRLSTSALRKIDRAVRTGFRPGQGQSIADHHRDRKQSRRVNLSVMTAEVAK